MDNTQTRRTRHQHHNPRSSATSPTPPSPRLLRCKSVAPTETPRLSYNSSISNSSDPNSTTKRSTRSNSNTKSRSFINKENYDNFSSSIKPRSSNDNNSNTGSKDGFVRFSKCDNGDGSNNGYDHYIYNVTSRKAKSVAGSPSAWALSPGRTFSFGLSPVSPVVVAANVAAEKKKVESSGGGGGVSGVLKYFRQKKKVSRMQEEDYHQLRIMYSRLLQWRFVNARTQTTMADVKINVEVKLFSVWLRILKMRNSIMEKKIEVQKWKQEIKLYQIMAPQISLLNEWEKLDGKNLEAVKRVTRKLVGISFQLPLVDEAKAETTSVQEAMSMAVEVMEDIQVNITKFLSQVEKILYLVTELSSVTEQESEYLEDVQKILNLISPLLEIEESLKAHLIQVNDSTLKRGINTIKSSSSFSN